MFNNKDDKEKTVKEIIADIISKNLSIKPKRTIFQNNNKIQSIRDAMNYIDGDDNGKTN
ncbi:MAG: hypothetical protein NC200_02100 [Candidatus Gastranaerophilales bacterium]|nr:hypothetical protein [Candidatus Gastranaerophilales bacterium]